MVAQLHRSPESRERGSVLFGSLLVLTLLAGFAAAQFMVVQSNLRQSEFYLKRTALHNHAESGLALAIHDVKHGISANPGKIGTVNWDPDEHDHGADGVPGTSDFGEGDGIPTPGEPNLNEVAVGASELGLSLITYAADSTLAGVQLVVSTCFSGGDQTTLQRLVKQNAIQFPRISSIYIEPAAALNIQTNGNSFRVNGNDTNPDGTPGPGPAFEALVVEQGANPGDNENAVLGQIPVNRQDQFLGLGGAPSIGETAPIDLDVLVDGFVAAGTNVLPGGTYSNETWGDYDAGDFEVTVINGNVELKDQLKGAGVLVIEGDLTMSGQSEFVGLVLVRGDAKITGGGSGVHIYGSLMVTGNVTIGGQADLYYSSVALGAAETEFGSALSSGPGSYETVYYSQSHYAAVPLADDGD